MKTLLIIAGALFVWTAVSRFRGANTKYKAALNCLMARHTFDQADDDLKSTAVFRSWRVLEGMGFSDPQESFEGMSEVEKCSVLALSFAELHISPPFANEEWHYVKRPLMQIIDADLAFDLASNHLRKTYGVDSPFTTH